MQCPIIPQDMKRKLRGTRGEAATKASESVFLTLEKINNGEINISYTERLPSNIASRRHFQLQTLILPFEILSGLHLRFAKLFLARASPSSSSVSPAAAAAAQESKTVVLCIPAQSSLKTELKSGEETDGRTGRQAGRDMCTIGSITCSWTRLSERTSPFLFRRRPRAHHQSRDQNATLPVSFWRSCRWRTRMAERSAPTREGAGGLPP